MNTNNGIFDEQQFLEDVKIDSLRVTARLGTFIFVNNSIIFSLLIFSLWESVPHRPLLLWASVLICLNALRMLLLRHYQGDKPALMKQIRRYKALVLVLAFLTSVCWAIGLVLFLIPEQSGQVMFLCITFYFEVLGGILSWISFLPGIIALSVPVYTTAIVLLIETGARNYQALAGMLGFIAVSSILFSSKSAKLITSLLRLNAENIALRRAFEKKSSLLEIAHKKAEQANLAKTRFLAAASHDLRQPIHALGLYFADLSEQIYSPNTAEPLRKIDESISTITSMLNALLDVSKLDAGIIKPTLETINLNTLFVRLYAEFLPQVQENHNVLTMQPTQAVVYSDPLMLERILRNLIINALSYTTHGRIVVTARPYGKLIRIKVLDNGCGIPQDQLEDIFIEFHQLQNPARDRRQGLGLGLAIVKRLAKLLKHELEVFSRVGQGSCFMITLPTPPNNKPAGSNAKSKPVILPNQTLTGRRILIIDDDSLVLDALEGLLTRWGCKVFCAHSECEAEAVVANLQEKLDLLIADYRLSDSISGIDVAVKLQTSFVYPLATLIITGDTSPERLVEAEASGFPLLHKPVNPAKLRSSLQFIFSNPAPD